MFNKGSSPPGRGEFRNSSNVNDRGGLPNSEQNVEGVLIGILFILTLQLLL
jgi:hypothetical protein